MKFYQMFKDYLEEKRLWEVFIYLFFGGLATVVNIVTFALAYQAFHLSWPVSNAISWICSVLFALWRGSLLNLSSIVCCHLVWIWLACICLLICCTQEI